MSPAIDKRQQKERSMVTELLRKTPIVQLVCEKCGIGRATYYRWRQEDSKFAKDCDRALEDGVLLVNDMAESQLILGIKNGSLPAIMFWLRNRHLAYGTKLEVITKIREDEELTEEQEKLISRALQIAGFASIQPKEGENDQ